MTSNFIEQFGFNDEEFADQDDVVEWVLFLHLLFKYYHVTQKVQHTTSWWVIFFTVNSFSYRIFAYDF